MQIYSNSIILSPKILQQLGSLEVSFHILRLVNPDNAAHKHLIALERFSMNKVTDYCIQSLYVPDVFANPTLGLNEHESLAAIAPQCQVSVSHFQTKLSFRFPKENYIPKERIPRTKIKALSATLLQSKQTNKKILPLRKVAAKLWGRRAHPPRTTDHATHHRSALRAPRDGPSRVRRMDAAPPAFWEKNAQVGPAASLALFSLPRRTEFLRESPTRARCRPLLPAAAARGQLPWTPASPGAGAARRLRRSKFARGRTSLNASRSWRTASWYVLGQRLQRSWRALPQDALATPK